MAKRILSLLAVLIALFATAVRAETFGAALTAAQEVPANSSKGFGNATVTLDPAHTSVRVQMNVSGLTSPINNAHIHGEAPPGVNANVQVNFFPATNIVNGKMDATLAISKENGDKLAANPQLWYVNVHTTQFPGGEIRGQLTQLDSVQVFAAELRGANEVPANSSTAVGSSLVTLDQNNNITWEVNATGLQNQQLGHIHEQVAGVNGNVVVTFAANASAFIGTRLKGSATIASDLAAKIRANPAGFYVNVHTTQFGGGEIRGQLTAANEYDVPVVGRVVGANGELFVTDLRVFNPSYTAKAAALVEYFAQSTPGGPNAVTSIAVDIPARGTAVLNDVAGASGLNVSGLGALRVSSASQLAVSSTVFNDKRGTGQGTIGQFVPGVKRSDALRRGVLAQLANNAASRTNIGFFNPNASIVNVRLELRDDTGTLLGSGTIDLQPLSQTQQSIGSYFAGVDVSNRAALSVSFDASAPIDVYASNIDNQSTDQIYITAVADPGVAAP